MAGDSAAGGSGAGAGGRLGVPTDTAFGGALTVSISPALAFPVAFRAAPGQAHASSTTQSVAHRARTPRVRGMADTNDQAGATGWPR